ncbi:hypothetical protein HDU93_001965 [Gonapodya sp. JEL0774]|nr:hypothetical protein HDU93_001965 [Gonapodya sp. JEL0774]
MASASDLPPTPITLLTGTFNVARFGASVVPSPEQLKPWLDNAATAFPPPFPQLSRGRWASAIHAPDLVVLAFQELLHPVKSMTPSGWGGAPVKAPLSSVTLVSEPWTKWPNLDPLLRLVWLPSIVTALDQLYPDISHKPQGAAYIPMFAKRSASIGLVVLRRRNAAQGVPVPIIVASGAVTSGLGGVLANKGAVSVVVSYDLLPDTPGDTATLCFITAHLNALSGARNRKWRNEEVIFVGKSMMLWPETGDGGEDDADTDGTLVRSGTPKGTAILRQAWHAISAWASAPASTTSPLESWSARDTQAEDDPSHGSQHSLHAIETTSRPFTTISTSSPSHPSLHDLVFLLGDLNYRLSSLPGDSKSQQTQHVISQVSAGKIAELVETYDELVAERRKGGALEGWEEGAVGFAPTYRFKVVGKSSKDESKDESDDDDTGDDQTDTTRLVAGTTNDYTKHDAGNKPRAETSVQKTASASTTHHTTPVHPLLSVYNPKRVPAFTDRILWRAHPTIASSAASILLYTSAPQVALSDHKPVSAWFEVDLAKLVLEEGRRGMSMGGAPQNGGEDSVTEPLMPSKSNSSQSRVPRGRQPRHRPAPRSVVLGGAVAIVRRVFKYSLLYLFGVLAVVAAWWYWGWPVGLVMALAVGMVLKWVGMY